MPITYIMHKHVFYGEIVGLVNPPYKTIVWQYTNPTTVYSFLGEVGPSIACDAIINYPTVVGSNYAKKRVYTLFSINFG